MLFDDVLSVKPKVAWLVDGNLEVVLTQPPLLRSLNATDEDRDLAPLAENSFTRLKPNTRGRNSTSSSPKTS